MWQNGSRYRAGNAHPEARDIISYWVKFMFSVFFVAFFNFRYWFNSYICLKEKKIVYSGSRADCVDFRIFTIQAIFANVTLNIVLSSSFTHVHYLMWELNLCAEIVAVRSRVSLWCQNKTRSYIYLRLLTVPNNVYSDILLYWQNAN